MNLEVWGPPVAVLVVGLLAGAILVWRARGEARGRITRREDLAARKLALVEELRGLQAERAKLPPDEYDRRFQRTLDLAAMALRDLEAAEVVDDTAEVERQVHRAVPGSRGAAWAAAFLAFFAILGLSLTQAVRPRGQADSMTGRAMGGEAGAGEAGSADLAELEARLQANPQDLDAAATLAHAAIRAGDFQAGMRYVDAGRAVAPEDPRILASLAALMIAIGMNDRAGATLDQVQAAAPGLSQGWLWRGVLELRRGQSQAAVPALHRALELSQDPDDRRLIAMLLADAQDPMAGAGAGVGADGAAVAEAPPTPGTGEPRLRGELRVEGSALPEGALIFVFARPSAEGRGPPLAALRIPAGSAPTSFAMGDGDLLMPGSSWPAEVWLSARVDTDGNAATREEGMPVAPPQGPLQSGATVELVLR